MERRPSIDRVRDMEQRGPEEFDDAREQFAQKQAKLEREASIDQPPQEEPEEFRERMEETLKESGKDSSED